MKNDKMFLTILVSIALILALILPASISGASSAPVSVTDDDSVIDSTMKGSGFSSGMVLNTPGGEVTPMVAAGWGHIIGLRTDGAVLPAGDGGAGQSDVRGWADIVQIAAGGWHTAGLKDDGTVIAVGWTEWGQCSVEDWIDIAQIPSCRISVSNRIDRTDHCDKRSPARRRSRLDCP